MRYIEVSDGISVAVDLIESVERNDDGLTSRVRIGNNIYNSTFPYEALLELLMEKEPEKQEALNILKTIGTFSG